MMSENGKWEYFPPFLEEEQEDEVQKQRCVYALWLIMYSHIGSMEVSQYRAPNVRVFFDFVFRNLWATSEMYF